MKYQELSQKQVDQFVAQGYLLLEQAFPRAQAAKVTDFLWERIAEREVYRDDRSTWVKPMVHIKENYSAPLFGACMTERLQHAVDDLAGPGRTIPRDPNANWGWWPINFAVGADVPWDVPRIGWHWDGQHFLHSVTAPDQGLLLLPHFSDLSPRGGGTLLATGSHRVVAQYLVQLTEPVELREGIGECNRRHPWLAELTGVKTERADRIEYLMRQDYIDGGGTGLQVVEANARAGDVVICHPFLYHCASQNHSGNPRFMCNRTSPLKEPMQLERADGDYSPVEMSIRQALSKTESVDVA